MNLSAQKGARVIKHFSARRGAHGIILGLALHVSGGGAGGALLATKVGCCHRHRHALQVLAQTVHKLLIRLFLVLDNLLKTRGDLINIFTAQVTEKKIPVLTFFCFLQNLLKCLLWMTSCLQSTALAIFYKLCS